MAKYFFVIASHDCAKTHIAGNKTIDDKFAESFFSVPLIGSGAENIVRHLGVSGIAAVFFVIFVIGFQVLDGFYSLYEMSEYNQTYKRSIANLAKATGFA